MSRYDELQKLQALKDSGALTDIEFESEKQRLLNTPDPAPEAAPPPPPAPGAAVPMLSSSDPTKPWGMDVKTYCMLLHLSQLAGFVVPFLGLALPIIMWAVNKDQFPEVDRHGKVVLNWIISQVIYFAVAFVLIFVIIGVPIIILLGLVSLIYAIIGAIKANDGQVWNYPGSIKFV
jgi:uncharacterized Tic20 family protein